MTDTTLNRLRSANPVPEVPSIDDRELFARITASPPDPRLRRTRGFRRRRFTIAAVAFGAIVLGATPVAITQLSGTSGPVKPPVTRHEYLLAQHQLTLPPGYHWPTIHFPPKTVTGVGAGAGHAVVVAQNDWECYWVKGIRDGDVAAQHRAYAVLERLLHHNIFVAPPNASENWTLPNPPKYPYVVFAADGGYQSVKRSYAEARAGHPKHLIESCIANR